MLSKNSEPSLHDDDAPETPLEMATPVRVSNLMRQLEFATPSTPFNSQRLVFCTQVILNLRDLVEKFASIEELFTQTGDIHKAWFLVMGIRQQLNTAGGAGITSLVSQFTPSARTPSEKLSLDVQEGVSRAATDKLNLTHWGLRFVLDTLRSKEAQSNDLQILFFLFCLANCSLKPKNDLNELQASINEMFKYGKNLQILYFSRIYFY